MKFIRMLRQWPSSLLLKTPYTCNLKVTQRCNLKCYFCGLHRSSHLNELNVTDLKIIADKLRTAGLARVVITGGEPFIRDDLFEIVELFTSRNFSTTLLTNGTLVSRDQLVHLAKIGLNDIGISLDTLNPDLQSEICGQKDLWPRIVATIQHSVEVFDRGFVEVLVTVTEKNLAEIPALVEFIHNDLGAWTVVNPVNIAKPGPSILTAGTSPAFAGFDPELVDDVYDKLEKLKRKKLKILVSNEFLKVSRHYLKTGDFAWNCDAGQRYFTIFSDGSLSPCSDLPSVGNILEMSPEYLRSRRFHSVVQDARSSCPGCIFSCWRESSYIFRSPSVCFERLKLAASVILHRKNHHA